MRNYLKCLKRIYLNRLNICKIFYVFTKMLTRLLIVRPNVRVQAKKNDFVEPGEAPGEGRRRPPNEDENKPEIHPIKKFIVEKFFIEEIDYEKFNKENKWAIHPGENRDKE
jgi:hypothetical protein